MTGFRNRAVLLLLALVAAVGLAQAAGRNATAPPQPLPGASVPPDLPVAPPSTPDDGIQVSTLGTAEGPPVGLLDSSNGGLGQNIWSGSDRAKIEELLARIPLASSDPAIRALARRIVLTKAEAPFGPSKRPLIAIRIEKLLDAGLTDEAGALAAQVTLINDADFARLQAETLLTANRAGDVCGDLTAARLNAGEPFWLELRAYCAAASGDTATAGLTGAVLETQGAADAAYATLSDNVLNHKSDPPGVIDHPTAMHVFLLQQAGLPIDGGVAAAMGTPENLLAMRDDRNPPPVRLAAAERIIRTGAASIDEMRAVADAQDLSPDRLAGAQDEAPNLPFFAGQVLLRRATQLETRPGAKAQLAFTALSLGDKAGLLPLAAGFQSDVIAAIKPDAKNRNRAELFARALLLAGRADIASRWLTDKDVLQTAVDLAAPDPVRDAKAQTALSAFATGLVKNPPDPDSERQFKALLLGVFDVLGRPLPPDARAQAPMLEAREWDGKRPGAQIMRRIEEASLKPERKGEALLLILDAIRTIGFKDLAPDVTIEFLRLLGAMGLSDAAGTLGVEALALYVPPPPPPPAPQAQAQ